MFKFEYQIKTKSDMKAKDIKKGDRIEANKLIMVVTGETETAFLGYLEYKGKPAGQCSLAKDMFTNPHFCSTIKKLEK